MCFTVAIAIPFLTIKRTANFANTLFRFVLLFQVISLIFDMITVYTVNNLDVVPPLLNRVFHIVFIYALCCFTFFTFIYVRQLALGDDRGKKMIVILGIPAALSIVAVTFAPLGYAEADITNYAVGVGASIVYVVVGIYIAAMIFYILRYWAKIDAEKRRIMLIALLSESCISVVQLFIPTLLVSGLGTTLITLAVYLTVENPDRVLRELYYNEKLSVESAKKKVEEIAYIDALTGIMNRRQFMKLASELFEEIKLVKGDAYVIIFDLDHFKSVNDTHGHKTGDNVLKCAVERVQKSIRQSDLFARYGGEEFVLFIYDKDKINIEMYAERIRSAININNMSFDDGISLSVSASFGITHINNANDLEDALNIADKALYEAKDAGRNRAVVA